MIKTKLTPSFLGKEGGKIISIAMVAMAMLVGLASSASAADLNWSIDTVVTIGGNNYTIVNGSVATAPFVVGAANLTVTVPAGTFTLTSANGYAFTLSDATGTTQTCSGATNQLVITGSVAAKTVTPDTGTVSCSGGGGSSGGGGGGDVTPPGDVSNVTATVSPGQVVLSWTKPNNSDFSSIRIYRSEVSGTRGNQIIASLTGTTYTDTSVTNGITYYYTIHAVDTAGNENTSTTQISAVPGVPTATPTPTPTPTATPLPGPATPAAPSGVTLYRVEGSPRVYVIKEGKKEWVKSADEFNAAGYKWENITVVSAGTLALYPDKTTPSGVTLYRAEGDERVYVVKDGSKEWVKSAGEFEAAGYKWSDIVVTTPSVVASYPDKTTPSGVTLYRAEGDDRVYAVKGSVKQWIKSADEFNSKGYKWSDVASTTSSYLASLADGTVGVLKVKVIGTDVLRVRRSNTTASTMLTTVKRNEVFVSLEEKSGWYKITTSGGIVGWISGAYAQEQ